jgi:CBS domain-containing protein
MKVKRISSRNIIRAPRSFTLEQAAVLMRQHHVGALLVTEDEPGESQAIGIVTDRDLVLQAIAEGIGPRELTLGDVMRPTIFSVSENADIFEALETMRGSGVRRLAVSAGEGVLVGIVSLDDIVDALGAEVTSLAGVIRSEHERECAEQDRRATLDA